MRPLQVATLVLLAALLAVPAGGLAPTAGGEPAAAAANGLWRKAVEIYRRNSDWYPGRVTILSEMLNRHGKPYSVTELFFTLRLDGDGQVQADLERALKNGKDTTEKVRSKVTLRAPEEGMEPGDANTYSVSLSDSPFDPERQHDVTVTAAPEKAQLFGCRCRRFNFTYRTHIVRKGKPFDLTWRGMAWLQEESGVPVKLEFTLDPLPGLLRSLWSIYLYDTASPDRWVVKRVSLSGHGGFLFIIKRFRTTTTFSDYRLGTVADSAE